MGSQIIGYPAMRKFQDTFQVFPFAALPSLTFDNMLTMSSQGHHKMPAACDTLDTPISCMQSNSLVSIFVSP